MRLIDADAVEDDIAGIAIRIIAPRSEIGTMAEVAQEYSKRVLRVINDAPTIDAVEVVRCKNCKHRGKAIKLYAGNEPVDVWVCTTGVMRYCLEDNFCSHGERRGDDE